MFMKQNLCFLLHKHKPLGQAISISSDSDANIDEKDLVQSEPEINEDSDEEILMIW